MIIAIDGPAGAGKSSVARACAKKLGFKCLDTGAMYRAVAWLAVKEGVALDDDRALGQLADECRIVFEHDAGDPIAKGISINGHDVTEAIRTSEIDKAVSPVSAAASVRHAMTAQQRRIGSGGDYVIEGRDIGTVVFPDAELKIFLTATNEERAHRRVRQNADRGVGSIEYAEVLADIIRRDEADSSRGCAPLKAADDARIIDSTGTYIEAIIENICVLAHMTRAEASERA